MKKKGFTIVELLLFMGLFSILIYVIMSILLATLEIKSISESVSLVHQDGRFILGKLGFDIHNANSIISPNLGESSSTLQIVLYGDPETYQLNNNNLELVNNTGTHKLNSIGSDVTDISFTQIGTVGGKNTIRISFTLQGKTQYNPGQEIKSFQTTVGLR